MATPGKLKTYPGPFLEELFQSVVEGDMSARDLAKKLKVSPQTIYRRLRLFEQGKRFT